MVEVFKTDVIDPHHAEYLLREIAKKFHGYTVNFDLQDCDHILRVQSVNGPVDVSALLSLSESLGFHAEVLADDTSVDEALQR